MAKEEREERFTIPRLDRRLTFTLGHMLTAVCIYSEDLVL